MKTQELLNSLGYEAGVKYLSEELGITVKEYNNYIILNYSQINSPKHHDITKECRALILDKNNNFQILARAFDRFLNFGEDPNSNSFDIINAVCMEKIDGSLITLRFCSYQNMWQFSTRKMALAEGPTSLGPTFNEIIMDLLKENGFKDLTRNLNKNFTYIFEFVSPFTRIVKSYGEPKLYYLGCRDNESGIEYIPALNDYEYNVNFNNSFMYETWMGYYSLKNKVLLPKIYNFNSLENLMISLKELPEMEEGYVCINKREDGSLWRLKIKNPSYLAIAHLRENSILSEKRLSYLVMANDYDEYLSIFPEDRKFFNPYIEARENLFKDIDYQWNKFKHINDKKEYALQVKDLKISGILFKLKGGKNLDEIVNEWLNPKSPKYDFMTDILNEYKQPKEMKNV